MTSRFQPPIFSPNGDVGQSLPGALLYFYENGSSTTPKTVFADEAKPPTPHTNPVVADGDGRFPQIFGDGLYSVRLRDADGNNIWGPFDNIRIGGEVALWAAAIDSGATNSIYSLVGETDGEQVVVAGYYRPGDGGGGNFYWDATSTDANDAAITILPTGHSGAGRWKRLYTGAISVRWFGARLDGSTDDYAAIQAAINFRTSGGDVDLGDGNSLTSAELVIDVEGVRLVGAGGKTGVSTLTGSHTSGAVVRVKKRSCTVSGVKLTANSTRLAAVTTTGHGLHIEADDVPSANSMSRTVVEDVFITKQPTDGFHQAGGFELSEVERVTVADCMRHGFVLGDGTIAGRTNKELAPFVFKFDQCRALECGGNALIAGGPSDTLATQMPEMFQFEALGCGWNRSALVFDTYQIYSGANQAQYTNLDAEDQQYANTTTATEGISRTANATPSKGIVGARNGLIIENGYFSSLIQSVLVGGGTSLKLDGMRVFAGTYGVNQARAIEVPSTASSVDISVISSQMGGATQLVRNQTVGARIRIDNKEYRGINLTTGDYEVNSAGETIAIVSGTLTSTADLVYITGEGDIADSLSTVRLAAALTGSDGLTMRIVNSNAYNITISHATGNIYTKTAANVVLAQRQGITLTCAESGASWIEI